MHAGTGQRGEAKKGHVRRSLYRALAWMSHSRSASVLLTATMGWPAAWLSTFGYRSVQVALELYDASPGCGDGGQMVVTKEAWPR